MANVYLLVFAVDDLNVETLASKINGWPAVIDWRSDTPNSVLILSRESAETLAAQLMEIVSHRGAFLISQVSKNFQGWLMREAWQFVNQDHKYAPGTEEPGPGAPKAYVKLPRPPAPAAPPTPAERLATLRTQLGYADARGSAKKWWDAFEAENGSRPELVIRLAEELAERHATISEFFLSYVYSGVSSVQANLHYLDYRRLKAKEDEEKERERRTREESPRTPASPTPQIATEAGAGSGLPGGAHSTGTTQPTS